MNRPILIGKAEEIDLVRPDVRRMLENEGLYIGGDTRTPNVMVPLVSQGGKVFSMKVDSELDPERFVEFLTLKGPYLPDTPFAAQWQPIETAPKDGTRILVVNANSELGRVEFGRWDDDKHAKNPRPFWRTTSTCGVNDMRQSPPTHWMPTPAKPTARTNAPGN